MSVAQRALHGPTQTVIAQPRTGWASLNLREVWTYRELVYFLVWRDIKVRYKQTLFGATWAVIQPFMFMVVFTLFLGRISGIAPAGVPYALFAYTGLVAWTLFSSSVIASSDSLVAAENLLQKVYFPRLILPIAAIGAQLFNFLIATAVLGVLMLYFGFLPGVAALWIIPLTVLAVASALAVGVWLSALNVRYRDIKHAVPFLVQLWLFASPVAYPTEFVPEQWRALFYLNPMAGVLDGFRWALIGQGGPAPVGPVLIAAGVTAVVLLLGLAYFRRVERTFADII